MDVTWEEDVLALFEDLEMQADGLYLVDRGQEVSALAEAGYAEVSLASRLQTSRGCKVQVRTADGPDVAGTLVRSGADWLLIDGGSSSWLVHLPAVVLISGLAGGSVAESHWPLTARLSVGSVLRRIAGGGRGCVMWLVGGRQVSGVLGRVGADFVTLGEDDPVVPFRSLVAVRSDS